MDRRDFLRRASLVAAGLVAADQLELLERLMFKRRLWPGHSFTVPNGGVLQLVDKNGTVLVEYNFDGDVPWNRQSGLSQPRGRPHSGRYYS
jgi:hypothetical protein